jgi:Cu+-exporting ATPase
VSAAREKGIAIPPVEGFQSRTGLGVVGKVAGRGSAVGNAR